MKKIEEAMADLPRLGRMIAESGFDGVIAGTPESVRYTGDVLISTQHAIRDRLAFIVWPAGGTPTYVLCAVEEGYVRQESWIGDFRSYVEFVTHPIDVLADLLTDLGMANGRVAMEVEFLAAAYRDRLLERLPGLTIEPAEPLFRRARMLKSPREVEVLQHGYRGTATAMYETYKAARIGEDEYKLSRHLADGILRSGAESIAFNHINAGPNTGFPHASPSPYKVQKGDILKADSGGYYHDYYSNVGRTAKVGPATPDEVDLWKRLRAIHHEIAGMLRPGATGRELFAHARVLHEKHGIPFPFAHNGHSIGLEVHERPLISPHEDMPYEPGMVSTVETRVRWVGKAGYHMEDLYLITEGDPVLLSDTFDNEEILEV